MRLLRNTFEFVVVAAVASVAACDREDREFTPVAPSSSLENGLRLSTLQPGEVEATPHAENKYDWNAYAMAEGKTLYTQFNCIGCHGHGGGGMGPPLMDDKWIYGHEPEQIYATIMQGRPNGMPSWRGKLTDDQVWKLVAYVRSMSGLADKNAAPGRDDHMRSKTPENSVDKESPKNNSGVPPSGEMPE